MPLIIKGKLIDQKSPVVCVSITEQTYDDIIAKATRLVAKHVEMVEWRADCFEGLLDPEMLEKTLLSLKSIFKNTIFLVTIRSVKEGGRLSCDEEDMRELLLDLASKRACDIMDVEYFQFTDPSSVILGIQNCGMAVIASHHDFSKTPSAGVSLRLLEEMEKADADLYKLAFMPEKPSDLFELGKATCEFKASRPDANIIAISMGSIGALSRIAPQAFGSCVTFASVDVASAPGQVSYDKLLPLMKDIKEQCG